MTYRAGLYTRLSKEAAISNNISDSIYNQIVLLTDYCKNNNISIVDTYIDDGFSGTTFDRPAFNRLLQDIKKGRINTVLTKDLSRLGRNYLEVGKYLEKLFPSQNVRYISVNDQIDTVIEDAQSDLVPFQNLFNELYVKDISEKVRVSLDLYRKKGLFIGSYAPYGFQKSKKYFLDIKPDETLFVKRIYEMFLGGASSQDIANWLNLTGSPTPGITKKHYRAGDNWNRFIVRRILARRVYTGDLEQGLVRKMNYKSKKTFWIPKEKHIVALQTHQAVICQKDWEFVQRILQAGEKGGRGGSKDVSNPSHINFSGLLFCYDCNGRMSCWSTVTKPYYICSSWKKNASQCTPHSIRIESLQYTLCLLTAVFIQEEVYLKNVVTNIIEKLDISTLKQLLDWSDNEYKKYTDILTHLENDKKLGKVNNEDYDILREWFSKKEECLTTYIPNLKGLIQLKENSHAMKNYLYSLINEKFYDRTLFITLYRRIQVFQGNRVQILCNFRLHD